MVASVVSDEVAVFGKGSGLVSRPGQKEPEPRNRTDRTGTGTERTVIEFGSSS